MVSFRKISPKKISDEIIEQFMGLLGRGELKPGDSLPSERELADLIGVSRAPLREALNALQAMGFVEIQPRSKIIVKSMTDKALMDPLSVFITEDIDKLFELLEMRRAMESWSAYLAAERATQEDIAKLQAIVKKDQANLKRGKDDAKTDADFHVTIAAMTHNTIFSHLMASCYHLIWNTQRVSRDRMFLKRGNRESIAEQHWKIFEAIRTKDPQKAGREAANHIDFVESELREMIAPKEETA
ncbi:MAG: FadR family transcriptional regulator [Deltaproteobacteria bacterium]|nr:FadR family transcriptional regulator [Deltaproteobacteria bacterium]